MEVVKETPLPNLQYGQGKNDANSLECANQVGAQDNNNNNEAILRSKKTSDALIGKANKATSTNGGWWILKTHSNPLENV